MRSLLALAFLGPALATAEPRPPVLVELFTSEGLLVVPPGGRGARGAGARSRVPGGRGHPPELHVDYWNDLGWADPFSAPEFTAAPGGVRARSRRRRAVHAADGD